MWGGRVKARRLREVFAQILQAILRGGDGLVSKVELGAIMRGEQQVAIGHRVDTPLFERADQDDIALRARHLDALILVFPAGRVLVADFHLTMADDQEFAMYPVAHRWFAGQAFALGDLVFVMWKGEIDSARVDIKLFAQVFHGHGRAFDMPAREADTPGAGPVHLSFWSTMFPQCEVFRRVLIGSDFHLLPPMPARAQVLNGVAGENAIFRKSADIVVNVPIMDVGQPAFDELLRHSNHLWNVVGGLWAEMRR